MTGIIKKITKKINNIRELEERKEEQTLREK
jgi:hypothetical protein